MDCYLLHIRATSTGRCEISYFTENTPRGLFDDCVVESPPDGFGTSS
jgi:hypothetical protein